MSVLYVRARDNVTPATFAVDFNNVVDTPGPFMVGISAWVTTADALAGILLFALNYDDPTASSRQVQFAGATTQLVLADVNSQFATEMVMLNRLSGSSIWTLDTTLIALAGSAKISYRILHSSAAVGDLQAW